MQNRFHKLWGFTFIELLIVFSIGIVITTAGFAAYSRLEQTQALATAQAEVASMIAVAKSRAQSQVKPPQCVTQNRVLETYQVVISSATNTYRLFVRCGGSAIPIDGYDRALPENVRFTNSTTVSFAVLTGNVSGSGTITLRHQATNAVRVVTVNNNGAIIAN